MVKKTVQGKGDGIFFCDVQEEAVNRVRRLLIVTAADNLQTTKREALTWRVRLSDVLRGLRARR